MNDSIDWRCTRATTAIPPGIPMRVTFRHCHHHSHCPGDWNTTHRHLEVPMNILRLVVAAGTTRALDGTRKVTVVAVVVVVVVVVAQEHEVVSGVVVSE